MNTAVLKYDEKKLKWEAWLGDKVIVRSGSREYCVSTVLDGTNKKIRKHEVSKLVDAEGVEINYIGMIRAASFVKNTDTYGALIASSVEHRIAINGPLAQEMKGLRDMFANLYYVSKSEFTLIKDMMYYTGGWPSAESPPRLEMLFAQVASVMKFYTYFGREKELQRYFTKFGLTITIDPKRVEALKHRADSLVAEDWYRIFPGQKLPATKKEIGNMILDKAMLVQKEICTRADAIKITAANHAEFKCSVKPEDFVAAVNTAARIKKTGMKSSSAIYKAKMQHVIAEAALNEALDQNS